MKKGRNADCKLYNLYVERESEFVVYIHNCMYISYVTLKIKYGADFENLNRVRLKSATTRVMKTGERKTMARRF